MLRELRHQGAMDFLLGTTHPSGDLRRRFRPAETRSSRGRDSADCTTATRSPRKSMQVVNHLPGLTYAGFQGESRLPNPIPACPIAADASRDYVPDLNWQATNPQSQRSVSEKPEKFLLLANHRVAHGWSCALPERGSTESMWLGGRLLTPRISVPLTSTETRFNITEVFCSLVLDCGHHYGMRLCNRKFASVI